LDHNYLVSYTENLCRNECGPLVKHVLFWCCPWPTMGIVNKF